MHPAKSAFALDTDFACADPAVQKSINSRQVAEWGAPLWEKVRLMRLQTKKSIQEKKRKIKDIEANLPQLKKEALDQIKDLSEFSSKKALKSLLWTDESLKLYGKIKNKQKNVDIESAIKICNGVALDSDRAFYILADALPGPHKGEIQQHQDRYRLKNTILALYSWNRTFSGSSEVYQITQGSGFYFLEFPNYDFDPSFDASGFEVENGKLLQFRGLTQNDEGDFKFRRIDTNLLDKKSQIALTFAWPAFAEPLFERERKHLSKLKKDLWYDILSNIPMYSKTEELVEQAFERMWLEKEISFDYAIMGFLDRWQYSLDKYDTLCRNAYAANVWRRTDAILSQSKLPNSMSISDEGMKVLIDTSASAGARPDESFYKEYGSKDAR